MSFIGAIGNRAPNYDFELNRDDIQSKGLISAVTFIRGFPYDMVRDQLETNVGAVFPVKPIGQGAEFTSTDRIEVGDYVGDALEKQGTLVCGWWNDQSTGDGHFFDSRAGVNDGWDFGIGVNSGGAAGQIGCLIDTGAPVNVGVGTDASTEPFGFSLTVATYDGANLRIYHNGVLRATAAQTGDATRTASPVKIGNQLNDAEPLGLGRQIFFFYVYDRAISSAVIRNMWLPQTRWNLYKQIFQRVVFSPIVGAITTSISISSTVIGTGSMISGIFNPQTIAASSTAVATVGNTFIAGVGFLKTILRGILRTILRKVLKGI